MQAKPCAVMLMRCVVQIEDYERSAGDDEHFGIDHLKAMDAAEASRARTQLETVEEESKEHGH